MHLLLLSTIAVPTASATFIIVLLIVEQILAIITIVLLIYFILVLALVLRRCVIIVYFLFLAPTATAGISSNKILWHIMMVIFVCILFLFPSSPGINVFALLAGNRKLLHLLLLLLDPCRTFFTALTISKLSTHPPYYCFAPIFVMGVFLYLVIEFVLEGEFSSVAPNFMFIFNTCKVIGNKILIRFFDNCEPLIIAFPEQGM